MLWTYLHSVDGATPTQKNEAITSHRKGFTLPYRHIITTKPAGAPSSRTTVHWNRWNLFEKIGIMEYRRVGREVLWTTHCQQQERHTLEDTILFLSVSSLHLYISRFIKTAPCLHSQLLDTKRYNVWLRSIIVRALSNDVIKDAGCWSARKWKLRALFLSNWCSCSV